MKEIDFIPDWYKQKISQHHSYRRQYVALGCLFVIMMLWNFITAASISRATAQVIKMSQQYQQAESDTNYFGTIKSQIAEYRKKMAILEDVHCKINTANILAELSYLIKENVTINSFDLTAEKFTSDQAVSPNNSSTVRAARMPSVNNSDSKVVTGDIRFKLVLKGLAANASDIAELICDLEQSAYFCRVTPTYSKNKTIQAKGELKRWLLTVNENVAVQQKGYQVSEFEITCYIANYRPEDAL